VRIASNTWRSRVGTGVRIGVAILACVIVMSPALYAVDYPCGTYSAGEYNSDCAVEAPATTPVVTPAPTSSGSSIPATTSSSDTTDTSTESAAPGDIILESYIEYTSETGKTFQLTAQQVVHFTASKQQHSVTVKEVTDDHVVVTIASTPHDVTIPMSRSVEYDVDSDGANDIAIFYVSRVGDVATLNFRQLAVASAADKDTMGAIAKAVPDYSLVAWLAVAGILIAGVSLIIKKRRAPPSE
jgi:hypothetical protein